MGYYCPECGVWPGVECRTSTGSRAGQTHKRRWPRGERDSLPPRDTKTRQRERARQEAEKRLPLDVALRRRLEERVEAFRAQKAA